MSDNKITQDQLEPNVMEELESGIGDLSTLSTENKDSLVAAVTEIYGKNVIAEAIGEPLAVTDTFSEMGNEINSLLSSFKTNMMNSGVTVESSDKFKSLIDKIATLADNNNKLQFVTGTAIGKELYLDYNGIEVELNFKPDIVVVYHTPDKLAGMVYNRFLSETQYVTTNNNGGLWWSLNSSSYVNETGFKLVTSCGIGTTNTYYAIGVGEEDTTLRDSLASILTEEGVSVTEEDDMASLIGKVDQEFDRQNNEMENLIPQYIAGDSTCIINFPINGSVAFDISGKEPQIDYLCLFKGSVKLNCNIYSASANEYWDNYFLLVLEDSLGNEVFSDTVAYESPYENSARSLEYSKTIENINVGYRIRLYAYGVRVGNANTEENRQYGSSLKVNYVNIYGDKVN